MLDKTKSTTERCYDYLCEQEPGFTITSSILATNVGIPCNQASAAMHRLEDEGIVKAISRDPSNKKAYVWEFLKSGYIRFHRSIPPGRTCPGKEMSSFQKRFADQVNGVLNQKLANNNVKKLKLSDRLLQIAIELEAQGL